MLNVARDKLIAERDTSQKMKPATPSIFHYTVAKAIAEICQICYDLPIILNESVNIIYNLHFIFMESLKNLLK